MWRKARSRNFFNTVPGPKYLTIPAVDPVKVNTLFQSLPFVGVSPFVYPCLFNRGFEIQKFVMFTAMRFVYILPISWTSLLEVDECLMWTQANKSYKIVCVFLVKRKYLSSDINISCVTCDGHIFIRVCLKVRRLKQSVSSTLKSVSTKFSVINDKWLN